jgi:hypothetical protein
MELYANKNIYEKYDKYNKYDTFKTIIKFKKYLIYSEFESDKYDSNKGYTVLCEDNKFRGYDSALFISEQEMKAKKFNL